MPLRPLRRLPALAAAPALLLALGCGDGGGSPAPAPATRAATTAQEPEPAPRADAGGASDAVDLDAARADYARYCASCHGPEGCGGGPLAAHLDPQPALHCDGETMNALSDEHLFRVIRDGGAAVGKSPRMAPWGGSLSDAQIRGLVAYLRTLADPPYRPRGPRAAGP